MTTKLLKQHNSQSQVWIQSIKNMIVMLLFTFVLAFHSTSQFGNCYSSEELTNRFLTTKTMVLITGDELFDEQFKLGMEKYWTHTEFQFVERSEMNKLLFDTNYSFIKPYNEKRATSNGSIEFSMLGLYLAENYDSKKNPLIASTLIDELNSENQTVDAGFRAAHLAKFMHEFIRLRLSEELETTCSSVKSDYIDYYNLSTSKIKQKTLYINENYLSKKLTKEMISDVYQGSFEIVSPQVITEGIESDLDDACYLVSISANGKYTFIVDFETGDILYAISHISGIGLNKKDFTYIHSKLNLNK